MGKTKFVGYRHVDYVAKDGRKVEGYNLYFTEEIEGVTGVSVFDAFVNIQVFGEHFSHIKIGSPVQLIYNRYARICGCAVII